MKNTRRGVFINEKNRLFFVFLCLFICFFASCKYDEETGGYLSFNVDKSIGAKLLSARNEVTSNTSGKYLVQIKIFDADRNDKEPLLTLPEYFFDSEESLTESQFTTEEVLKGTNVKISVLISYDSIPLYSSEEAQNEIIKIKAGVNQAKVNLKQVKYDNLQIKAWYGGNTDESSAVYYYYNKGAVIPYKFRGTLHFGVFNGDLQLSSSDFSYNWQCNGSSDTNVFGDSTKSSVSAIVSDLEVQNDDESISTKPVTCYFSIGKITKELTFDFTYTSPISDNLCIKANYLDSSYDSGAVMYKSADTKQITFTLYMDGSAVESSGDAEWTVNAAENSISGLSYTFPMTNLNFNKENTVSCTYSIGNFSKTVEFKFTPKFNAIKITASYEGETNVYESSYRDGIPYKADSNIVFTPYLDSKVLTDDNLTYEWYLNPTDGAQTVDESTSLTLPAGGKSDKGITFNTESKSTEDNTIKLVVKNDSEETITTSYFYFKYVWDSQNDLRFVLGKSFDSSSGTSIYNSYKTISENIGDGSITDLQSTTVYAAAIDPLSNDYYYIKQMGDSDAGYPVVKVPFHFAKDYPSSSDTDDDFKITDYTTFGEIPISGTDTAIPTDMSVYNGHIAVVARKNASTNHIYDYASFPNKVYYYNKYQQKESVITTPNEGVLYHYITGVKLYEQGLYLLTIFQENNSTDSYPKDYRILYYTFGSNGALESTPTTIEIDIKSALNLTDTYYTNLGIETDTKNYIRMNDIIPKGSKYYILGCVKGDSWARGFILDCDKSGNVNNVYGYAGLPTYNSETSTWEDTSGLGDKEGSCFYYPVKFIRAKTYELSFTDDGFYFTSDTSNATLKKRIFTFNLNNSSLIKTDLDETYFKVPSTVSSSYHDYN